jgi:hypothetical protein
MGGKTHEVHVLYPILLSDYNQIWNISLNFSKTPSYKFHEIKLNLSI